MKRLLTFLIFFLLGSHCGPQLRDLLPAPPVYKPHDPCSPFNGEDLCRDLRCLPYPQVPQGCSLEACTRRVQGARVGGGGRG